MEGNAAWMNRVCSQVHCQQCSLQELMAGLTGHDTINHLSITLAEHVQPQSPQVSWQDTDNVTTVWDFCQLWIWLMNAGSLMSAWQTSKSHSQRADVILWISRKVQEITEDDAQALHDRDPDHPGLYDEVCSRLSRCAGA